ncbi:MAG: hypothetical protein OFPII_14650 [Osedax symbiont Rs1]|nr:MAG: hypothetical protein OFPII_14650 [Osedax symbiont Rs1]
MVRPNPSNPSIGDRYSRKRLRKIIALHTATSYNSSQPIDDNAEKIVSYKVG